MDFTSENGTLNLVRASVCVATSKRESMSIIRRIDNCAHFFQSTYVGLDGTHDENVAALAAVLDGDEFNARRVLRSWMLLSPRELLGFWEQRPGSNRLREWVAKVID